MKKIIFTILVVIVVILVGAFMLGAKGQIASVQNSITPQIANVGQVQITLNQSGFTPNTITIQKGTKVVWTNQTGQTAAINSDDHPTHLLYLPLNLGQFENGQLLSLVFDTPGTYGYHNHLNPTQTGKVIVK